MKVIEWLNVNVSEGDDITPLHIPHHLLVNDDPDEILYYKEVNECGLFCQENHPFAKVERYGHWYRIFGQDKRASKHSDEMTFDVVTKDKVKALQMAQNHIE